MKSMIALLLALSFVSIGCSHHGRKHHKHWKKMDTNSDGAVSKEEFNKAHAEKFAAMDANSDGKITKEEKKAYKKASKKHSCDGGKDK